MCLQGGITFSQNHTSYFYFNNFGGLELILPHLILILTPLIINSTKSHIHLLNDL